MVQIPGPVATCVNARCSFCITTSLKAGHSYIESPGEVLNANALPAKNAGIENVEWFTTRLYPNGAIDPVPVAATCTS